MFVALGHCPLRSYAQESQPVTRCLFPRDGLFVRMGRYTIHACEAHVSTTRNGWARPMAVAQDRHEWY
eukprot:3848775-Prymnesium_polylepis.1